MPVNIWDERISEPEPRQSFISWAVRKSLPLLDAEAANEKIVDLTVELMAKQAELDALRMMREGKCTT